MNFFLGGRGAGPGSQCGVVACTLAFATLRSQDSVRNYAFRVSMLDETGLYAPSMAHIILAPPSLPRRPCPAVLGGAFLRFMGIISTVSRQLRYALTREHTLPLHTETRDLRPLRCCKIVACVHRSSPGAYASCL